MEKRKWVISLATVLVVTLMITGYFAVSAEYGSSDDPLVSLSYINDVLAPGTIQKINDAFELKKTEFDSMMTTKLQQFTTQIDQKIAEFEAKFATGGASGGSADAALIEQIANQVIEKLSESGTGTSAASTWTLVKLNKGKTLTGDVGCQIVLRIGSANCVASGTPGLINLSDGSTLANGKSLALSNLYLITVQGRGITATADATILVSGSYTIK